ncbi:hypothetical protein P43SY_008928 [Pythium insidiosum]|uniref:Uncharacterized protein n=1 Tax=Pythium insidiosum TaxID=114742 RepID=A0AAD5MI05_PYTIN|nr:hypothetical protein P43SY_008928 [Pythium insidiosum]
MLTTQEALALVHALVKQLPPTDCWSPTLKFSVVARRSPREPIEVDCRAIRLALRLNFTFQNQRLVGHVYELLDLLSWLAVCPGCTVTENVELWQQLVRLLVGDTISSDTITFGDAALFPRWIISLDTFDRDQLFVQELFALTLADADASEAYVQAMARVRPLVEKFERQPLGIPVGIDLDCSRSLQCVHLYEQIRAFVKSLRISTAPNRIKFDSLGLTMGEWYGGFQHMNHLREMDLLMRDNSDVWVSRFVLSVPSLDYESYGSDNENVLSITRVRSEYGNMVTHLLRDPRPGDPPLCVQFDAHMGTWQASIDYDATPEFEVLATSKSWVGILVPGYGFGWVQSSLVERVWTEPLEDVMQPSHSVRDLILNCSGFEPAPVLLREIGNSLEMLALRSMDFTGEMTEDTVDEIIRTIPNVTTLEIPSIKLDPLVRAYKSGVCRVTSLILRNGFREGPELLDGFLAMLQSKDHAGSVMLQAIAFEFRSFHSYSNYPLTNEGCLKVVTQMMLETKNLCRLGRIH